MTSTLTNIQGVSSGTKARANSALPAAQTATGWSNEFRTPLVGLVAA